MRRRSKEKFKSITKNLLKLLGVGTGVTLLATLAGGRSGVKLMKSLGRYSHWQIIQTLKELRLRGYIMFNEKDENAPIILTDRGMERMLNYRLRDIFKDNKKWDYLWRMVIFDIPENKRFIRESFRRKLNYIGFYQLQKSVFVAPFKCEEDIIELCRVNKISKHVLVLTVASLGPMEDVVRKHFFSRP